MEYRFSMKRYCACCRLSGGVAPKSLTIIGTHSELHCDVCEIEHRENTLEIAWHYWNYALLEINVHRHFWQNNYWVSNTCKIVSVRHLIEASCFSIHFSFSCFSCWPLSIRGTQSVFTQNRQPYNNIYLFRSAYNKRNNCFLLRLVL